MKAYTHPGLDKEAFLGEIGAHARADQIKQGKYWHYGKGCAVGCSLHSVQRRLGLKKMMYSDHSLFEKYLGIPTKLAHLEDCIFEGLSPADAQLWPMRFADAAQTGADLSEVWNKFAPWMLREIVLRAVDVRFDAERAAVIAVAHGYETAWSDPSALIAYAATNAACYATFPAISAVVPDTAAAAARNATHAAEHAVNAATNPSNQVAAARFTIHAVAAAVDGSIAAGFTYATYPVAATFAATYRQVSDKLCELMRAAPVPEIAATVEPGA